MTTDATPQDTTSASSVTPTDPANNRFQKLTDALQRVCQQRDGVIGLVLLGSTADAERRDEWSDHDFFVLIEPGTEEANRAAIDWLPEPERIAIAAREGAFGFSVVYDDGHIFEFAVATPSELESAPMNDSLIVHDEGPVTNLVNTSTRRVTASDPLADPSAIESANEVALMMVKLMIGVGRARRGELLAGGQMVRTWATNHLIKAIRGRVKTPGPSRRDTLDPVRRFEFEYSELGTRIARIMEEPVEEAALRLFELARRTLEPEWELFPSRGADAISQRLGWPR